MATTLRRARPVALAERRALSTAAGYAEPQPFEGAIRVEFDAPYELHKLDRLQGLEWLWLVGEGPGPAPPEIRLLPGVYALVVERGAERLEIQLTRIAAGLQTALATGPGPRGTAWLRVRGPGDGPPSEPIALRLFAEGGTEPVHEEHARAEAYDAYVSLPLGEYRVEVHGPTRLYGSTGVRLDTDGQWREVFLEVP